MIRKKGLSKLVEVSIMKTLRFNLHYFGIRGLRFPVLVARNMRLRALKGGVELGSVEFGIVRLGFSSVGIFDHRSSRGMWEVFGKVRFDGRASFGQGAKISVGQDGSLSIGEDFRNMAEGQFICHDKMRLGRGSLVSWETMLMDTDFHHIDSHPSHAPLSIGDNVWIGCRCIVLKGARVPYGSVLAAGSIITKQLNYERSVYGGINMLIKQGIIWNK